MIVIVRKSQTIGEATAMVPQGRGMIQWATLSDSFAAESLLGFFFYSDLTKGAQTVKLQGLDGKTSVRPGSLAARHLLSHRDKRKC